jgi:hypothetical protein
MKPNDFFEFYEVFKFNFSKELEMLNIGVLSDFFDNKEVIFEFYRQYFKPNEPKIVLCGINPGRFGAGQTGIPFLILIHCRKFFLISKEMTPKNQLNLFIPLLNILVLIISLNIFI